MRRLLFLCLATFLLLLLGGCREHRSVSIIRDACTLVSKEDVESVQKSPVNDMKGSERSDDLFRVSQRFYTTTESGKSANLALVQQLADQQNKRSPKEFWKEKFDPYRPQPPTFPTITIGSELS